ncbi:hypothetical protein AB0P12_13645 [Streptomyces subrutilus]|uniref:hypothetical protein n=1 Tax=Streptomyces subrutilus TaxID=36818 RepID=UPI003402AF2C
MDAVAWLAWLAWSTGGLLVVANLGVGGVALWCHRAGRRAAARLIASGELDAYRATWLAGTGYARWAAPYRQRDAAEIAMGELVAAGLPVVGEGGAPLTSGGPGRVAEEATGAVAHPLVREAWAYVRAAPGPVTAVTARELAADPAFARACTAHANGLSGYLPGYRTRRDDLQRRAPRTAAWITTGWVTAAGTVLLARLAAGTADARGAGAVEVFLSVVAAALGTAALSGLLLLTGHHVLWLRWQNRWPRTLRDHCAAVAARGPAPLRP